MLFYWRSFFDDVLNEMKNEESMNDGRDVLLSLFAMATDDLLTVPSFCDVMSAVSCYETTYVPGTKSK